MRVLVACEFSGAVRDAFAAKGHDAWSCDLLASDAPGNHIQGDVLNWLIGRPTIEGGNTIPDVSKPWDLMIAHPPCTFLNSAGLHWIKRGRIEDDGRPRGIHCEEALDFVRALLEANIPHIALENPIGCISTRIRKWDQKIQPHEFGDDASKSTCLWLKGLPKLVLTGPFIAPRMVDGKPRWANQTDSGQNNLGPSDDRWALRSITYPGIARAMAEQWSLL